MTPDLSFPSFNRRWLLEAESTVVIAGAEREEWNCSMGIGSLLGGGDESDWDQTVTFVVEQYEHSKSYRILHFKIK